MRPLRVNAAPLLPALAQRPPRRAAASRRARLRRGGRRPRGTAAPPAAVPPPPAAAPPPPPAAVPPPPAAAPPPPPAAADWPRPAAATAAAARRGPRRAPRPLGAPVAAPPPPAPEAEPRRHRPRPRPGTTTTAPPWGGADPQAGPAATKLLCNRHAGRALRASAPPPVGPRPTEREVLPHGGGRPPGARAPGARRGVERRTPAVERASTSASSGSYTHLLARADGRQVLYAKGPQAGRAAAPCAPAGRAAALTVAPSPLAPPAGCAAAAAFWRRDVRPRASSGAHMSSQRTDPLAPARCAGARPGCGTAAAKPAYTCRHKAFLLAAPTARLACLACRMACSSLASSSRRASSAHTPLRRHSSSHPRVNFS